MKGYLSGFKGIVSDNFIHRIFGFLDKMKTATTKDILREWIANGFLGFVQADLKAWDALRNRVAHGELVFNFKDEKEFAELQAMFKTLKRVQNIINKLILFKVGYKGSYFNHAVNKYENFDYF